MKKNNKDILGFQMLSILSQVDGDFKPEEGRVIVDYIKKNFPLGSNLDAALDELTLLDEDDYLEHFEKAAYDFMEESNIEKIIQIFNYLDDGEYYNNNYGFEYIKYKFTKRLLC